MPGSVGGSSGNWWSDRDDCDNIIMRRLVCICLLFLVTLLCDKSFSTVGEPEENPHHQKEIITLGAVLASSVTNIIMFTEGNGSYLWGGLGAIFGTGSIILGSLEHSEHPLLLVGSGMISIAMSSYSILKKSRSISSDHETTISFDLRLNGRSYYRCHYPLYASVKIKF